LSLTTQAPQPTLHEPFRIVALPDGFLVEAQVGNVWQHLYRVSAEVPLPIDLEVANWYKASHRTSRFVTNLIIARPGDGCRHTLFNTRYARRGMDNKVVTRTLRTSDDYNSILRTEFDLALTEAELTALVTGVERRAQAGHAPPFVP
jgi:N-hydroxyarylamine O-acetyltransferase